MMHYYISHQTMQPSLVMIGIALFFRILFWALIILAVIALVKMITKKGDDIDHEENNAINILKQRYAKGEIDRKEFLQMKKEIS